MQMSVRNSLYFILFLGLTTLSCQRDTYFDQVKEVPQPWLSEEKISFVVPVNDTLSPFDFHIQVRSDVDYNFANIYFFLKTVFPDGRYSRDTVNIWLADVNGKWLGKGNGKYRDTEILFRKKGRFPMRGEYRFEFEQAMRTPPQKGLNGIESIGIRIGHAQEQ